MRVCFRRTKNQTEKEWSAAVANYLMQGEMDLIKVEKKRESAGPLSVRDINFSVLGVCCLAAWY
jgi:hypothetical protein